MRLIVVCPACSSGNYFDTGEIKGELRCQDCGFALSKGSSIEPAGMKECIICGSIRFYHNYPFFLWFLLGDSVCYVCETRYKNLKQDKFRSKVYL